MSLVSTGLRIFAPAFLLPLGLSWVSIGRPQSLRERKARREFVSGVEMFVAWRGGGVRDVSVPVRVESAVIALLGEGRAADTRSVLVPRTSGSPIPWHLLGVW